MLFKVNSYVIWLLNILESTYLLLKIFFNF